MDDLIPTVRALGSPVARTPLAPGFPLPLAMARWRHRDAENEFAAAGTVPVIVSLSGGQRVERRSRGTWVSRPSRIGYITVVDPDVVTRFTIRGEADVLLMLLPRAQLALIAHGALCPPVRPRFNEVDSVIERCAIRALVAMHRGEAGDSLLLSSIASRLAERLMERPPDDSGRAVGGLSRLQVRRVEELIEAGVAAPVATSPSLGELAAEAGVSLHHFAREFRRSMGTTPYAYMLHRRLQRARDLLARADTSIETVGQQCGFGSPAHFADRFRREVGVTPRAFRRAVRHCADTHTPHKVARSQ